MRLLTGLVLFSIIALSSCKDEKKPIIIEPKKEIPKVVLDVSAFNPTSAYDYIAKQVAFGPRVPGTAEHKACKEWLVKTFQDFKLEVSEHHFTTEETNPAYKTGTNIIGRLNPYAKKRVLLTAHWDTRHAADRDQDPSKHTVALDGADDGGSGVGVILELARILSKDTSFNLGVDFVLFDLEDQGEYGNTGTQWCLGSAKWASEYANKTTKANFGILLDMVGAQGAVFPREAYSRKYASHVLNNVWNTAADLGHSSRFINAQFGEIIDDHKYINEIAHIPTIDIIHVGTSANQTFGTHWHTMNDNMSVIDPLTLKAVGETVLGVLYLENK